MRIIPWLLLVILVESSQVVAAETAKVRFVITMDVALADKGTSESADAKEEQPKPFVPARNAIISFAPPISLQKLKSNALRDWAISISDPVKPQTHTFQIKDDNYFPKVLAIRAGDSLTQTQEVGKMYFEGMIANAPFGILAMPGAKYTFERPERSLIKVRSNPHAARGGHSREAYLLVLNHTCVSISNEKGDVVLTGLPIGVEIPMQVFYPGADFPPAFDSPTLKFEKNKFTLVCDQDEVVHHIRITASQNRKPGN